MVAQDAPYKRGKCQKRCFVGRCLMDPQCLSGRRKGGDYAVVDILNYCHRVLAGLQFAETRSPRERIRKY
jgi:hypothetical protein